MDHTICPGSRKIRQPKPEQIICPACGHEAEIWSDELRATCPHCKKNIVREGVSNCLDWCDMGKECVGETLFNNYREKRSTTIRQQLFQELESAHLSGTSIAGTARATEFAEDLCKKERGNPEIVIPSVILLNLPAPSGQTTPPSEGAGPARTILLKIGLKIPAIEEICDIIAILRNKGAIDSKNFSITHDVLYIQKIQDGAIAESNAIVNRLLTLSARETAESLLTSTLKGT
jgi:hypothetical protein